MAIEIIRRGEHPNEKTYTAKCYTCSTQVRFKRNDGKYHPGYDQRDGPTLTIPCPVCDDPIMVVA